MVCFYSSIRSAHNLIGQPSPTDTYLVKNVLEGAKRKLATPTVKKEPITPELLSLMYNSNYKENDLFSQRTSLESAKMLPQTRYNSKCLTGHKFESVRTITTELPSLYISVLLFGMNMQIYVASKIMSFLLICNNSIVSD
jgi:hypothetical protein